MGVFEHLEKYLGPIDRGWKATEEDSGIRVLRFPEQPYDGVTTFATLGLSDEPLPMNDRSVRQELLVFCNEGFPHEQVVSFLSTFAEYVRGQNVALLRGDVVGPGPPLIPGARCNGVYVSMPVLYEDDLATFRGSTPPTVFPWLIPLREEEARFIQERGWQAFEERLEVAEIDFGDLDRPPVV